VLKSGRGQKTQRPGRGFGGAAAGGECALEERAREGEGRGEGWRKEEEVRKILIVMAALAIWATGAYPPWKMSLARSLSVKSKGTTVTVNVLEIPLD
jgi:hypothetical protein